MGFFLLARMANEVLCGYLLELKGTTYKQLVNKITMWTVAISALKAMSAPITLKAVAKAITAPKGQWPGKGRAKWARNGCGQGEATHKHLDHLGNSQWQVQPLLTSRSAAGWIGQNA